MKDVNLLYGGISKCEIETENNVTRGEASEDEEDTLDDSSVSNFCRKTGERIYLPFQDTSLLGDVCLNESRIKCRAFWEFVDSRPHYYDLIQPGYYTSIPTYKKTGHASSQATKIPQKHRSSSPSYEARWASRPPVDVKARAQEEKRRFKARCEARKALQIKSGQAIITAKRMYRRIYLPVYADEIDDFEFPRDILENYQQSSSQRSWSNNLKNKNSQDILGNCICK